MKHLQMLLNLALVFILATACGEGAVTDKTDPSANGDDKTTTVVENKLRPDAPPKKFVKEYKTSPDDKTGFLLNEEQFNEKGLRTVSIGYDYYGSGNETDRTTYEYNDRDQLVKRVQTDEDGQITTFTMTYDEKGRLKTEKWSRANGQGASEENIYDEKGNLAETKYYDESGEYDFSRTHELTYDGDGNITEEKNWEKYTDGSADLLQSWIRRKFDANGNRVEKSALRDDGSAYSRSVFEFDGAGNMLSETEYEAGKTEPESKEVNEYNEFGEVVKNQVFNCGPGATCDGLQYTTVYTYDAYGAPLTDDYTHTDGEAWGSRWEIEYALVK